MCLYTQCICQSSFCFVLMLLLLPLGLSILASRPLVVSLPGLWERCPLHCPPVHMVDLLTCPHACLHHHLHAHPVGSAFHHQLSWLSLDLLQVLINHKLWKYMHINFCCNVIFHSCVKVWIYIYIYVYMLFIFMLLKYA